LQCRAVIARIIGNQVRILSDPVTVNREFSRNMPLDEAHSTIVVSARLRRLGKVMICESGNLL